MGHSFKVLKLNFFKYFNVFYDYLLRFIYWGSVPSIVLYGKITIRLIKSIGLLSKPYSPLLLAMWSTITGEE